MLQSKRGIAIDGKLVVEKVIFKFFLYCLKLSSRYIVLNIFREITSTYVQTLDKIYTIKSSVGGQKYTAKSSLGGQNRSYKKLSCKRLPLSANIVIYKPCFKVSNELNTNYFLDISIRNTINDEYEYKVHQITTSQRHHH